MKSKAMKGLVGSLVVAGMLSASTVASAATVEVLHWWTSGGEAKALGVLKNMLQAEGDTWKDFAVAGGGGANAMTVLKSRVVSGNPPTAAQVKGPAIQEWAREGVLANLDNVATKEQWNSVLPPVVQKVMKYQGHYVAVPVNIHRVNWIWANPEVFKKAGAKIPTSWHEFVAAANKLKKAGFVPVAHGDQPWQDATVFEDLVLSVGGAKMFREAFVDLNPKVLGGRHMVEVFKRLRTYKSFTDKGAPGRDWNLATAMVMQGKAGMQWMGDWAKGEFLDAGKKPGSDFVCAPVPGTAGTFTLNTDSFIMFKLNKSDAVKGQDDLARAIMSKKFQEIFNLYKGSIPVRTDVSMAKFDSCGKESHRDLIAAQKDGGLVPSMAHGMSSAPAVQGAIYDVVTNYYDSDQSPSEAAKQLAKAVKAAQM